MIRINQVQYLRLKDSYTATDQGFFDRFFLVFGHLIIIG